MKIFQSLAHSAIIWSIIKRWWTELGNYLSWSMISSSSHAHALLTLSSQRQWSLHGGKFQSSTIPNYSLHAPPQLSKTQELWSLVPSADVDLFVVQLGCRTPWRRNTAFYYWVKTTSLHRLRPAQRFFLSPSSALSTFAQTGYGDNWRLDVHLQVHGSWWMDASKQVYCGRTSCWQWKTTNIGLMWVFFTSPGYWLAYLVGADDVLCCMFQYTSLRELCWSNYRLARLKPHSCECSDAIGILPVLFILSFLPHPCQISWNCPMVLGNTLLLTKLCI